MKIKIISKNKRAFHDYFIQERLEAGIILQGTEIKSLRNGKVSMTESHVSIDKHHEIWIHNMKIPLYEFGNINNHQESRKRKLLLKKSEIIRLAHKMNAGGYTIIPIMIYFKKSYVKIEIALGKGKMKYDKRQEDAKKDVERKLQQKDYSE